MKESIVNNKETMQILNALITNEYYKGYISIQQFELSRNHFPNN